MTALTIGIRVSRTDGISFFGIEEANEVLKRGVHVASVAPGDVIMVKTGESEGKVHITFGGCNLRLMLEEEDECRKAARGSEPGGPG
jgi:hypothetical protein